jgi:Sulfotransferase family
MPLRDPAVPVAAAQDRSTVPVMFIMGKGRSGSTIVNNILGQVPGMFAAGELLYLWDWGLRQRIRCGCGADVLECPIWSKVLNEAFNITSRSRDSERIEAICRDYRHVARWHHAPRLLARRTVGKWPALQRYTAAMAVLFRTVADVTGAQVIVDSSKKPVNPAALGFVDGVEATVVHLVRDPRAVCFSWQRSKAWTDRDEGGSTPRFGPVYTSASWAVRNIGTEVLARRWPSERVTRLRYEDFSREPQTVIRQLVDLVGLPTAELPFRDENTVVLEPTHTIGGNPDRMTGGDVTIAPDSEWANKLDGRTARIATVLTRPLLRRYGYRASGDR